MGPLQSSVAAPLYKYQLTGSQVTWSYYNILHLNFSGYKLNQNHAFISCFSCANAKHGSFKPFGSWLLGNMTTS